LPERPVDEAREVGDPRREPHSRPLESRWRTDSNARTQRGRTSHSSIRTFGLARASTHRLIQTHVREPALGLQLTLR